MCNLLQFLHEANAFTVSLVSQLRNRSNDYLFSMTRLVNKSFVTLKLFVQKRVVFLLAGPCRVSGWWSIRHSPCSLSQSFLAITIASLVLVHRHDRWPQSRTSNTMKQFQID